MLSSSLLPLIAIALVLIVTCLLVLDFFGTDSTDGYVVDNMLYAKDYKRVLNLNKNNGYVSLERILYFYLTDDNISYEKIYEDNLDLELKKMKPISQVCLLEDYKDLSICTTEELNSSNQIDEYQNKPFTKPIDFTNINITSFFMEQRIVFDTYNVHKAWDFGSSANTKVYAVCDGKIDTVSFPYKENLTNINGGLGNYIKLKCNVNDTIYNVIYGHLFPNSSTVSVGDYVTKGQVIAEVGTTGYSTGNHLHYQVQLEDNTYIDGMSLIDFLDTSYNTDNNIFNKPELGQNSLY